MRECLRCENPVTERYHRVNSNNDGELWSCTACTPEGEVLINEDDESHSKRYEDNLDRIKNGGNLPQFE